MKRETIKLELHVTTDLYDRIVTVGRSQQFTLNQALMMLVHQGLDHFDR